MQRFTVCPLGLRPSPAPAPLVSADAAAARKRRSIVDIAKANPIRIGKKGVDLDKLIDESISEALADKLRRSNG